jgi:translocation and assembly module TamA
MRALSLIRKALIDRGVLWCSLLLLSFSSTQAFELQLNGLTAKLRKNVVSYLEPLIKDEKVLDDRLRARIEDGIRQALRAKGYYTPSVVSLTVVQQLASERVLKVNIDPGRALTIAGVKITVNGDAKEDVLYQALLEKGPPAIGDVLDHGQFDHFLSQLSNLAAHHGYFDAELIHAELQVVPSRYQAFWNITFNSGNRYCFGSVLLQGSPFAPELIQTLIPFKVGDPYTGEGLLELSRRLSATQWFNSVTVTPQFERRKEDGCLPLLVLVTPRKRNNMDLGLGYVSGRGPGFRMSWQKPWINRLGHSVESSLQLAKPEQQLTLTYRLPLLKNPLEQYYLFSTGFENKRENDTCSKALTVDLARYWDLWSGWQPSFGLHWRGDHFTQGTQPPTASYLLYPSISINRIRQHGGLMPDWGDSQRYTIDCSRQLWPSAVTFTRFQLKNVWIRTPKQYHRYLIRLGAGLINTSNFSRIPASLRFFAGGDGSIRGYPYHSLSPKDSQGKLTGASRLATGSAEYHYLLTDAWWLALFIDSGVAAHKLTKKDIKRGVGVGLRWSSPIGPIKMDIARAINDRQHRKLQFYLAFGSEL